ASEYGHQYRQQSGQGADGRPTPCRISEMSHVRNVPGRIRRGKPWSGRLTRKRLDKRQNALYWRRVETRALLRQAALAARPVHPAASKPRPPEGSARGLPPTERARTLSVEGAVRWAGDCMSGISRTRPRMKS